ncbi:hypothetical protein FQZ97_717310 [compost metagenome]
MGAQALQALHQFVVALGRHRYPQYPGELPGHARHFAFQPVAAMGGDALGDALDQPGLIRRYYRKYQMIHTRLLIVATGARPQARLSQ